MEQANRYHPGLFWLALATSVITFLLIGSGGTVTSTGVGMVDETWSLSFLTLLLEGFQIFRDNLALFIEHKHRLIGFIVGLLAMLLAIYGWRLDRHLTTSFFSLKRQRQWIGIALLLAVTLQGALGAARIIFNPKAGMLNPLLGRDYAMIHGFFGQVTFAFIAACTLTFSRSWVSHRRDASSQTDEFLIHSKLLTLLFLVQLTIAVLVRHYGGGLLIIAHASVAGLILLLVGVVVARASRLPSQLVRLPVFALGLEVLMMIVLGTSAWWFGAGYGAVEDSAPSLHRLTLATLHQWLGALTLATSLIVTLRARRHLLSLPASATTEAGL